MSEQMQNDHPLSPCTFQSYAEDARRAPLPVQDTYITGNQRVLAVHGNDGALWAVTAQVDAVRGTRTGAIPETLESVFFTQGILGENGPAAWFSFHSGSAGARLNTIDQERVTGYAANLLPETRARIFPAAGQKDSGLLCRITTTVPLLATNDGYTRPAQVLYQAEVTNPTGGSVTFSARLALRGALHAVRGGPAGWSVPCTGPRWNETAWVYPAVEGITLTARPVGPGAPDQGADPGLVFTVTLEPGAVTTIGALFALASNEADLPPADAGAGAWRDLTRLAWQRLLGDLAAGWADRFPAFFQRAAVEALLCLRLDSRGQVVGIAPSPLPAEETPLLADALFTAAPILYLQPETAPLLAAWLAAYIDAHPAQAKCDLRARMAPALIAGLGFRLTGAAALDGRTIERIERLLNEALAQRVKGAFPTERVRRHTPLMPLELGGNILCWAALHHWAKLRAAQGEAQTAAYWQAVANEAHQAVQAQFRWRGPGEEEAIFAGLRHTDPAVTTTPLLYYEGDALEVCFAPYLGFCAENAVIWKNTARYMFTGGYALTRCLPETVLWWEQWNANGLAARKKVTHPAVLGQIASRQGDDETFDRAMLRLEEEISITGSLWELDSAGRRMARSGRLAGAAFLTLLHGILGIQVSTARRRLTAAPRTTWRWVTYRPGADSPLPASFDVQFGQEKTLLRITNRTKADWTLRLGGWFPDMLDVLSLPTGAYQQPETADRWQTLWLEGSLPAQTTQEFCLEMQRRRGVWKLPDLLPVPQED